MVKLTPRLQKIANEIKAGETMADIGTDHGFLPIYLWEEGISPNVIMADISRGSLDKARDNCRMLHPEQEFDLRLGSGIEVLE
ncbi:MAG: tRNA (adenine(22)-N(1))-methyltransferase TrmK, partial [Firmicutes bacterium]|nr:tRNA (adenine(22)-N(1))-methyltransferase TrmK [Bacillota bacterium]